MGERKVAVIKLVNIRENKDALRPVNKESEDYLGLVDSIKTMGLLNPISVREVGPDKDGTVPRAADGSVLYALIDGLHRYNAAIDAGLTEIPVNVVDMDQAEVYEAQIAANVHKIETKPVEYTKAVQRIMALHPTRTVAEQASRLGKSAQWLKDRLNLLEISESVQKLIDEGKIKISNAVILAKLPAEEQTNWIDKAMTMTPNEFAPAVAGRVKQIKEDKKKGKASSPETFTPTPHLRKFGLIKEEYLKPTELPRLLAAKKITNPVDAIKMAMSWVMNMDEETIAKKKAEWDARQKAAEEAAKKRAEEKAAKKQKEAAEAQAAVKAAEEELKAVIKK